MDAFSKSFLSVVEKNRDKLAVWDTTGSITYGELFDLALRVNSKLEKQGVKKGDFVTIELPRCMEYVGVILGVWFRGAVFAALDSGYPADRLDYIAKDCNAKVRITEDFLRDIKSVSPLEKIADNRRNEPALLIYTSGSTGKPKGVLHSRVGIVSSALRYSNAVAFTEEDRNALSAPFTFVASTQGVFGGLISGVSIYLTPNDARRDPAVLADFLYENQITVTFISPKMLKLFRQKGHSLRLVTTGSERVSDVWSSEFKIMVCYGSSESAATVLAFMIDRPYENTPVGRLIGDEQIYILDENKNEAEEGEICLAGDFALEYLGMPEKTAETFIANPFSKSDGYSRLLCTGDIGRRLPDGNILYVNRKDWMVKINGQRVEPGEIEAVIKAVDGVHDAVVKDFTDKYKQIYLAAYFVLKEGASVSEDELRKAIAEKLPPYMMPQYFVRLDKLPVNANGKLDRMALLEPAADEFKQDYEAPTTDKEKYVCAAFEKILGADRIGVNDVFFRIGGDSIKAVMLSGEFREFGISVSDIYELKTPKSIAERLSDERTVHSKREAKPAGTEFPLTPAEQGMYLEQQMDPSSTEYNINIGYFLSGTTPDAVEAALKKIFEHHEAFRSLYRNKGVVPVRIIADHIPAIGRRKAGNIKEAEEEALKDGEPFDLNGDIPVRAFIYELPEDDVCLQLSLHHIGFDGGSANVVRDELLDVLNGRELPDPDIDLSDISEIDRTKEYEAGEKYYDEVFKDGVPANEMPIKGSRPVEHPASDSFIESAFEVETLRRLEKTAAEKNITFFELLVSALAITLGKYCSSEDIVIGLPSNMRDAGMNETVGMFVNTSPVRLKPVRDMKTDAFYNEVRTAVRSATRTSYLPFSDIVKKYCDSRDRSRSPIFDVSLNYLISGEEKSDNKISIRMVAPVQKMKRDFGITLRRRDEILTFNLQYSSELFDKGLVERFAEQFMSVLGFLSDGKEHTIREASVLPKTQEKWLEKTSVSGTAEIPIKLLHKVFEKVVSENSEKTALIASDKTLSYAELNKEANRIANALIKRGVKSGDSVMLLLNRRSYYFSAMFGVLKAGAAFIPCDIAYPKDRIESILEDSDAKYIITVPEKAENYPADRVVLIDELFKETDDENPDIEISPDALAYLIYTSGSTGKPKGVMLRHLGICNYLFDHPANVQYQILNRDCRAVLSVTTIAFDMSLKETTGALCNGKTLVFADEAEMNDPRALTELFTNTGADCFNATPSRIQQYMEYPAFKTALGRCRLIMCGGEGYPMQLLERLRSVTDASIVNTYGPTEITVSSNGAVLTKADHISVGRPLLNVREFIVDPFSELSPRGVSGELYIGGMGVALGYKNLPEQTAEKFIEYRGERVFRSGDLCKWDNDGNVVIFGRLDSQVKLRGLRIELGEIESLIDKQDGIEKCVVVVRKLNGQENLCAYFTAEKKIDVHALNEVLSKELTHYMVPAAYLQLDRLPVTPNGKVDTKHLPEPELIDQRDYAAPENEAEKYFCSVFEKILNIDRVGAEDDFFKLGGTSLLATSIIIDAEEKGYNISYGELFNLTTPRMLAGKFAGQAGGKEPDETSRYSDYDYQRINELLEKNTVQSYKNGEHRELGNILITGATGYLGIHILAEYLKREKGTAYCFIRKGRYETAALRLKNMFFYYFDDSLIDEFEKRVIVYDGDVTDPGSFTQFEKLDVNTVFNCAANVKHFSSGTDIEDINVGGAKNCVAFCKRMNIRLIHFSTVSIGGALPATPENAGHMLSENELYFGQSLNNQYVSSKFIAEREVLQAAAEGYDMKVIRVGTLSARASDGLFQINFLTNSFAGRLRSYFVLGCFPYSLVTSTVRMGPIDLSAEAALLLAKTPKECCLYHAINNNTVPLDYIIRVMNTFDLKIDFVEDREFAERLTEAEKDPQKAAILQSMIAYRGKTDDAPHFMVEPECDHTNQILAREGFFWEPTDREYVRQFIDILNDYRFFDTNTLNR